MTATNFILEANRLGCEVLTDGERVGLRGPREVLERLQPELGRLKPELLKVLRDGTAAEGCACICCRPGLWPDGYEDVVGTWPREVRTAFKGAVAARVASGMDESAAKRLSYDELRGELGRQKR